MQNYKILFLSVLGIMSLAAMEALESKDISQAKEAIDQSTPLTTADIQKDEESNPYAQLELAIAYQCGKDGKKKDYFKALLWYEKAHNGFVELAKKGDQNAQYALGNMFENGYGVTRDLKEACKWYEKAAEQGHVKAQFEIGWLYTKTLSKKLDLYNPLRGVKWLEKAASKGHLGAQYHLGYIFSIGAGPYDTTLKKRELPEDKDRSNLFYQQTIENYTEKAEKGDAYAQKKLGLMHNRGIGAERNPEKSEFWTKKAIETFGKMANHGDADALYQLGLIYREDIGVQKDIGRARENFIKAAEKGHADAMYKLHWRKHSSLEILVSLRQAALINSSEAKEDICKEYKFSPKDNLHSPQQLVDESKKIKKVQKNLTSKINSFLAELSKLELWIHGGKYLAMIEEKKISQLTQLFQPCLRVVNYLNQPLAFVNKSNVPHRLPNEAFIVLKEDKLISFDNDVNHLMKKFYIKELKKLSVDIYTVIGIMDGYKRNPKQKFYLEKNNDDYDNWLTPLWDTTLDDLKEITYKGQTDTEIKEVLDQMQGALHAKREHMSKIITEANQLYDELVDVIIETAPFRDYLTKRLLDGFDA